MYADNRDWDSLRAEIGKAFDAKDFKKMRRIADAAIQNLEGKVSQSQWLSILWMVPAIDAVAGNYKASYAGFTSLLVKIESESSSWDLSDPELIHQAGRCFGDWAKASVSLPEPPPEDLDAIFARAERFVQQHGCPEMRAELCHSASVCLEGMERFKDALAYAEEGLALRRIDLDGPGCGLEHHLEIYSSILVNLNRFDDAWSVMEELCSKFDAQKHLGRKARLRWRQGQLADALALFNEIGIWQMDSDDFNDRGLLKRLLKDREGSQADLVEACVKDRKSASAALWLFAVTGDESALRRRYAKDGWNDHLLAFARGNMSEVQILQKAEKMDYPLRRRRYLSYANGILGAIAERSKARAKAKKHYAAVKELACQGQTSYWWACCRP